MRNVSTQTHACKQADMHTHAHTHAPTPTPTPIYTYTNLIKTDIHIPIVSTTVGIFIVSIGDILTMLLRPPVFSLSIMYLNHESAIVHANQLLNSWTYNLECFKSNTCL
jgi:hypothetical protein